jgi:hypothetical protein
MWILLSLSLVACGAKWTDADAQNATDIANAALSLEQVCDRDGGPCPGAGVRAIERGTYCAATSQLYRHGADVPDGGVVCRR